jgi:ATP-dependent Lhr-like helicase
MAPTSARSPPSSQNRILERLDDRICDLIRRRGFAELSEAQEKAIPAILENDHVLLIAPTGTGKTESAMLPVFTALLESSGPGFRALYITPLRSLNRDIMARLEWWCRELGLSIGVRHGDTSQSDRRKQALSPPDLLITTPETLQAMYTGKRLREHLKQVRFVVVDEIHELAGSKRGAQLSVALERLTAYAGEFQRIALSATVGNPETVGSFLCGDRPFTLVEVPVAPHLDLSVRFAGDEFKDQVRAVAQCLDRERSTLLFVNTRVTAEALGHQLYDRGDVEVHHGSLSREVRIDAEERFKRHEIKSLICTSSMELGIDIGHVEHVLQFGSPREVARLVQRVGRAGHRLNTVSRGSILATGFDDLLESLVIARRAKANECENIILPLNAADVMANQVAALVVEYGEIERSRVAAFFEHSACFSGCRDLLDEVCSQMALHRLIRIEESRLVRTGRSRTYLYANLSMIPDERKIAVFDVVSRRIVGSLDESFVLGWVHTGAVFITKGQLWQVLDLEEGRILVEPAHRAKGELPSWEGEQIPVPFAVAREVGRFRRTRDAGPYPVDPASQRFIDEFYRRMDAKPYPVADDRLITLEHFDEGVMLNICAGHKANEAIARLVSILLSARFGSSIGIETGPYRILFRLPSEVSAADIIEVLETVDPGHIHGILSLAMKRTALFKWKLVQIAKKFGAIDTDADYERISIHRLLDLFDGTVIQREAYRELFSGIMDIDAAAQVIGAIHRGEIDLAIGPLSPLGGEGLLSSRDMIPPPTADMAVLNVIRRRIESDHVILFCMNCRRWKSKTTVARVAEVPECPSCGARLIAALKPWEDELIDRVKRKQKNEEDRAVEVRLLRNANIVLSSGRKAVIALAARGVGPEAASRILLTQADGEAFYREILKAERNYIRTHRFW